MSFRLALLAGAVALASSCVTPDDPLGATEQAVGATCPKLFCGNTPYLGAYPFWDADETGVLYSTNGLRIRSVTKAGVPLAIAVDGFKLYGVPLGGGPAVSIYGSTMVIESKGSTTTYELSIQKGTPVPYYEGGDDGTLVGTYRITYVEVLGNGRRRPPRDLCLPETGQTTPRDAIIFQGDRYDSGTGELVATGVAAEPWFNITCKEDALWKLALMRHVEPAQDAAHVTSPEQRMAGLRSIRADYCGDGIAYTAPGTAVDWLNAGLWLELEPDQIVEAIWTDNGAACLGTPRLYDLDEISCAGALPSCVGLENSWTELGSFITYVPDPV